jgi:hypothetical protein
MVKGSHVALDSSHYFRLGVPEVARVFSVLALEALQSLLQIQLRLWDQRFVRTDEVLRMLIQTNLNSILLE